MARTFSGEGLRNLERDDFAGLKFTGKSGADAILAKFGGASPTTLEFSGLEHADLHARVDGEARVAASVSPAGLGGEFFAGCWHVESQWSVASVQWKPEGLLATEHCLLSSCRATNNRARGGVCPRS